MNFKINPLQSRTRKQKNKSYKKRKSPNFGKGKSAYRLYIEFLPQHQQPHKGYNYYSRDQPNHRVGLENLLKRVLNGTCKGRYGRALLYEELTNQCLKVYLPGKPMMSYWDYKIYRKKLFEKPLLKAQVKFQGPYIDKLISKGKRHSVVLRSMDNSDKAAALEDLKLQLLKEPFLSNLRWADVYDQEDNRKVVQIYFGGRVEVF